MERVEAKARLSVEDDGKGFPESEIERREMMNWLVKGENSDGSGVGLAYVRDAVEVCGGSLELGDSESLGGARVTIILPISKPFIGVSGII